MQFLRILIVGLMALAFGTLDAVAAGAKKANAAPEYPPALNKFVEVNADILKLGDPHGLPMWAVSKRDKTAIVFTSPDGQLLIPGPVFGANGENLSESELEAVLRRKGALNGGETVAPSSASPGAAPAASDQPASSGGGTGAQLLADFEKSFWIPAGDSRAPVVYMMVDPECGYSRDAWKILSKSFLDSGGVQVRLVPVGRIAKDSERLAALVVGSSDARSTWDAIARGEANLDGQEAATSSYDAVKANTAMLDKWANRRIRIELPFFVYRGGDGRVKVVSGEPDSMQSVISDVRGQQLGGR